MAVIHDARGQVLDGLTQMLLRLARKVEWKIIKTRSNVFL
jgi:hypothetical protein